MVEIIKKDDKNTKMQKYKNVKNTKNTKIQNTKNTTDYEKGGVCQGAVSYPANSWRQRSSTTSSFC